MATTPLTSTEKGDALHHAVLAIERHILHTAPHLKDKNFTIQDKKIINSAGVHHEIDIFVSVESAPGYSAIYIFECKNWKDAVGKSEVIDFIEKIHCANATHGYFVAKSFTKDAYAQAEKSARLTLLIATENDPVGLPIPGELHTVSSVGTRFEVNLYQRGRKSNSELEDMDMGTAKAELNGTPMNLNEYLLPIANETISRDVLTFRSHTLPVGEYEREGVSTRVFQARELLVNERDIELLEVRVNYTATIYRPAIVWSFDVEKRGRVMTFAPVVLPGGEQMVSRIVMNLPQG
jgi:Restriction endonuclease